MAPEHFRRLEELFEKACALPSEARAAAIASWCAGDAAMHQELVAMLEAPDDSGWQKPLHAIASTLEEPLDLPPSIGPYRVVDWLGSGGSSAVYLAEDAGTRIAVKVLMHDDPLLMARFADEQAILASLNHPFIPRFIDTGMHESRPYIAMEYVAGVPITRAARDHSLGLRGRIALLLKVCEAVKAVQKRGIIHRDLKPSNILIVDGPNGLEPRIIDFGIAHCTEALKGKREAVTKLIHVLGSYGYMPPEQFSDGRVTIDRRADVYALGALLYELVVGETPELPEAPLGGPPLPPPEILLLSEALGPVGQLPQAVLRRRDRALLREDVDHIVRKALKTRREERHTDVTELAADLQDVLNGRPSPSRPPGTFGRWRTHLRRHRKEAVLIGSLFAALFAAAIVVGILQTKANAAERMAQWTSYVNHIGRAEQALRTGDSASLKSNLDACDPRLRDIEYRMLAAACRPVAQFDSGASHPVVGYSLASNAILVPMVQGMTLLNPVTMKPQPGSSTFPPSSNHVGALHAGQQLSAGHRAEGGARHWWLWNGTSARDLDYSPKRSQFNTWAVFSADGNWLAISSWGGKPETGTCSLFRCSDGSVAWTKTETTIGGFVNGQALVSRNSGVHWCDLNGTIGERATAISSQTGAWRIQEYAPFACLLVNLSGVTALDRDCSRTLWNTSARAKAATMSSDGSLVAVSDEASIRMFSFRGGEELASRICCDDTVESIAFLSGDRQIVAGCSHGMCQVFDATLLTALRPSQNRVATAAAGKGLWVVRCPPGIREVSITSAATPAGATYKLPQTLLSASLSADEEAAFLLCYDGSIRWCDSTGGFQVVQSERLSASNHTQGTLRLLAISRSAALRLSSDRRQISCDVISVGVSESRPLPSIPGGSIHAACILPDKNLAAIATEGRFCVFRLDSGKQILDRPSESQITALAFRPDGGSIALGTLSGSLTLVSLGGTTDISERRAPIAALAWVGNERLAVATKDRLEFCRASDFTTALSMQIAGTAASLHASSTGLVIIDELGCPSYMPY